jgi:hypothetical protein
VYGRKKLVGWTKICPTFIHADKLYAYIMAQAMTYKHECMHDFIFFARFSRPSGNCDLPTRHECLWRRLPRPHKMPGIGNDGVTENLRVCGYQPRGRFNVEHSINTIKQKYILDLNWKVEVSRILMLCWKQL